MTAQAVNLKFAKIREEFRSINVEHPVDFIAWRHGLNDKQRTRLRQAFSSRATSADAALIEDAETTLREMKSKHGK